MPAFLLTLFATCAAGVIATQGLRELPPQGALLLAVALGAFAAWVCARLKDDRWRCACAVIAGAALGVGYAGLRAEARLADALPTRWEGESIAIVGVVDDLPQNTPQGAHFAFEVERIDTPDATVPTHVSLGWYAERDRPETAPQVHAGERWRFVVRLRRPHGSVNPAGFDLEAWLLEHGLRATGYVRGDREPRRLDAFAGRANDYVQRARERVRERIVAALPGAPYAGVLVALAIGDQRAIPESQWHVFNRTGVSHLISISGLHVTAFATLAAAAILAIARRFPRLTTLVPARKIAIAGGFAFAVAYVLLAGAEVPALRTLAMLGVAGAGLWLARPGTASAVWLWSLMVVLILDPWAALAPGFWLSFGAVGLLLYAGSGRIASEATATRGRRVWRALRAAGHAQWVVTLGLVPGTLALFQQVSLVSVAANAVAIPVVTFAIVPIALFGIVVPIDLPWHLAHAILEGLMAFLQRLSQWPAATWAASAPLPWTVIAGMAGALWILAPRGVPGRALGALWLLPLFIVAPGAPQPGTAQLIVLDVGQGLAVVVRTATHALLYDTGARFGPDADAGSRIIVPFLRSQGIGRLDTLIVSHRDLDHSGGAASVLAAVPVETFVSSLRADHELVRLAARSATTARCVAGQQWDWDGVRFTVLHPPPPNYAVEGLKTNDLSCVVRVATPHASALVTGDIEARSETQLLRYDSRWLAADVLVVPHHGSRTSSTLAFVAAVHPQLAIFAAGYRNRFGHPRADVVERYADRGAVARRTDLEGALTLTLSSAGPVQATAARETQRRYWHDRDGSDD